MFHRAAALGLVVTVLLGLALRPVWADDDAPEPSFGAQDVVLEEDGLPKGWSVVYDGVTATPGDALETWATSLAEAAGIDEDDLLFETRILKSPEGAYATLLVVEVDGDAKSLPEAVEQAARAKGYVFRRLGYPSRMVVIVAPDGLRDPLLTMETNYAVKSLSSMAHGRIDAGSEVGAKRYARDALAIAPDAAGPHAVLGMVAVRAEDWDGAIAEFVKAFAANAPFPPEGRLAMWAWRNYGYALLKKKTPETDRKAKDALAKAVALEKYASKGEFVQLFVPRYNLACAMSRLEEVEGACAVLEKCLEMAKDRLGEKAFERFLGERVMKDEDLENLRGSACYKALIEKITGGEDLDDEGL